MLSHAVLGVLAGLPCLEQDPQKGDRQVEAKAATAKALSDKEAREAVAEFQKSRRDNKARLAERLAAVQQLGSGCHDLLVKPLMQTAASDPSVTVRKTAVGLLAHQPEKAARRALLALIERSKDEPELLSALITSLSTAGYKSEDWDRIEPLFERDFSEAHVGVQQAILKLVTFHREKQAWRLLVRHLDAPAPADVDAADNPPAEYWEKRWKAWRVWRADAVEALFAISGQRFSSQQEAKAWIRENGAEVGLR